MLVTQLLYNLITHTEILGHVYSSAVGGLYYVASFLEWKVQVIKWKLKTVSHHRSLHRIEQVPMTSVTDIIIQLVQQNTADRCTIKCLCFLIM